MLRSSHENFPSSGVFVDSYTCKADPDKICYTVTIYKQGSDGHAPFIVEEEISAGDSIMISTNDGNQFSGYFSGYSYSVDPNEPFFD
ncbi:MAG: hypothetical protein SGJ00_11985 [bacterium]|nr:hypothetical protein [bacterium]